MVDYSLTAHGFLFDGFDAVLAVSVTFHMAGTKCSISATERRRDFFWLNFQSVVNWLQSGQHATGAWQGKAGEEHGEEEAEAV